MSSAPDGGRRRLSTWAASGVFPELKLVNFTSLAISSPNWK